MKNGFAFLFGCLFGLGLLISGMSNPEKVLNFLDIFGQFDSSLIFVMVGAIAVTIIPFQKAKRHPKTLFNDDISLPENRKIDLKLIVGATMFGVGWGIAGICPAPALTLIGLGYIQILYFIAAMLVGMWLHRIWFR
ncbi:DUF6691 family protein [Acinetobacter sp. MD2(2019)]|uniref:DUF6691 family protein n=1 Tax=Acinetobacter sp. MD2(2019) TaxID=2605273 RepID=UPI002D1EA776|nr:DUF6691 family protein [Acinetobacter sp. MD2(2019)]MEB3754135.1 YeeE/YedE family protein [Acinetobacter sp. MD2(2019)]